MENESQRHRLERCQKDVEEHPDRASSHYNLGLTLEYRRQSTSQRAPVP